MSIGIGGIADLFMHDQTLIAYNYCCYNLNIENRDYFMKPQDGEIYIDPEALAEPEIREKVKKTPSGKKKIVKRIPVEVDIYQLLKDKKVSVKNASGTWYTIDGTDSVALHMLREIFLEYQLNGALPEHIFYFK